MAVRSETHAEITADPHVVWNYLADVSRWPEWAYRIRECRVAAGAALQAGARLEQRAAGAFGRARDRTLDLTAVEAPRELSFNGSMGPSPVQWGFELAPTGNYGTDVLLWIEVEPKGPIRALPAGVLRGMFGRVNERELAAIKSAVE